MHEEEKTYVVDNDNTQGYERFFRRRRRLLLLLVRQLVNIFFQVRL